MTQAKGYTVHPDSWAAHLDDGESLVWTGVPIKAFRFHTQGKAASVILVGQITLGMLAVSFLSMAIVMIQSWHPILIVLTFLGPGLGTLSVIAVWKWLKRRSAQYALTSTRAIVAFRFPFKHLQSYPIYRDKPIIIERTNPRSLYFAHIRRQSKFTSYRVCYGFEYLADFDAALKHATTIQDTADWRPRSYTGKSFSWPLKSSEPNAT